MQLPLPDKTWDMDPKDLERAGFDDDSIEAQAWGEWGWMIDYAKSLRKESSASEAEWSAFAEAMADRHRRIWGRFSTATAEYLKAVCEQ